MRLAPLVWLGLTALRDRLDPLVLLALRGRLGRPERRDLSERKGRRASKGTRGRLAPLGLTVQQVRPDLLERLVPHLR